MMRWIDDDQSVYGRRLIATGVDIDEAMEMRYLAFFDGKCDIDHPALDIERFIDEILRKDNIEFEPEAVDLQLHALGATKFNPDGSRLIQISAKLYRQRNSAALKGRFRFTCAHEVFHAVFHGPLFRSGGHLKCFEQHVQEDMVEPEKKSNDFTEWQANRGAAALLMPGSIFKENVKRLRAISHDHVSLVRDLASRFDVSKQSVQIRLQMFRSVAVREDDFKLENDGIDSYQDARKRVWN